MTKHWVSFSDWPVAHFCFLDVPGEAEIEAFAAAIHEALDRGGHFVQIVEFRRQIVSGYLAERLSKPALNEAKRFIPQCQGVAVVTKEIGPMAHTMSQHSDFLQLPVPYTIVTSMEEAESWAEKLLRLRRPGSLP